MLTLTHVCCFATIVTISILLGVVFGQPNANAGRK